VDSTSKTDTKISLRASDNGRPAEQAQHPLVSLILPAYNEAVILQRNLTTLRQYMESLEHEYRREIILVNDGSTGETGAMAEAFAEIRNNIHVLHHVINFGLGQALKSAFNSCRGARFGLLQGIQGRR
jgi:glycosyltransferase involved in cell wall biosynthesis